MSKHLVVLSVLALTGAVFGATVTVSDVDGLLKAVAALEKDPAAPREIVLRPGRYFLERPLVFGGEAAKGLVLRAEKSGKAELCGATVLGGWTMDAATGWWVSDVSGADGKCKFFHMLVKNGKWVDMTVYPGGKKRFKNGGRFDAKLLPNLAGHWSRNPTDDESFVMPYEATDLPDGMNLENAYVHLFHMWDDTLTPVASVDRANHTLRIADRPGWPMGACGKNEYELRNVKEGMKPGCWFVDRQAAKLYYCPRKNEKLEKSEFLIPSLQNVLTITNCPNLRLEGLVFSGATPTAAQHTGFAGIGQPCAVQLRNCESAVVKGVVVRNTAGGGMALGGCRKALVTGCTVAFTGSCGLSLNGARDTVLEKCLVSDAGKVHGNSTGVWEDGSGIITRDNEVRRTPYSGIICFGHDNLLEANHIHHVMQVLHDGAAIYGLFVKGVMRKNVVTDVVALGKGFGVHAYYADEASRDTVVEDNYAEGMPVPIHNHMSSGIIVRNNTLVNRHGDMKISFERSVNGEFYGNRIVADGQLETVGLDGIKVWKDNFVNCREWNPERPVRPPQEPLKVIRAPKPPVIDGKYEVGEWPGDLQWVERTTDGHETCFSAAYVRFMYDDDNLYVSAMSANFGDARMSFGSTWMKDDGMMLDFREGRKLYGFNDGTRRAEPESLAKAIRFAGPEAGKGARQARYEIAIPWAALGVKPAAGLRIPFDARAFVSEFGQLKCWDAEGRDAVLVLEGAK